MRDRSTGRSLLVAGSLLILVVCSTVQAITIFKISGQEDDEAFPAVSGSTVVWQTFNSQYGDWDVVGAGVSNGVASASFPIGDFAGDDQYPMVDGNDVVWQNQADQNSDGDVYGAKLLNGQVVTKYAVSATAADEALPSVSNGVAVWQHKFPDAPDWDILGAKLAGKDDPKPIYVAASIDVNELFPSISGSLVVWQQSSPDLPEPWAYGADISDPNNPRSFYTTMALGVFEMPCLSEGWLVARETDDTGKVTVDNLFDPFNPEGISSSNLTAVPRIHKHIVVWQDKSNGTWDIRGYNLLTRREFAITNMKMSDQVNPSVFVDAKAKRAIVAWQDNRDGNWDIYAAILDGPDVATQPAGL